MRYWISNFEPSVSSDSISSIADQNGLKYLSFSLIHYYVENQYNGPFNSIECDLPFKGFCLTDRECHAGFGCYWFSDNVLRLQFTQYVLTLDFTY